MLERVEWQPGSNIHLTIDAATQKAADAGLRKSPTGRGAVVAIDPRTGAILAFSSAPDFDPNALLSSDPAVVKKQISELPEFNNAISGTYSPGSTFKPIVSAAGLNEGRIHPDETIYCPGHFELGRNIFRCWDHKGHKTLSFLMGFAKSCDVYFYKMGLKTGGAAIERYSALFGLGAKTNIALRGEKAGHLFGPETRASVRRSWYDGDTVNLAIGQGELLVTPIQMAVIAAAIANRGTLWRPHYTERIEYTAGRPEYRQKPERGGEIKLKDSTWDLLHQAMGLVVTDGTAHRAAIKSLEVHGKTGTTENSSGEDHAWFIAFANRPGQAAEIAVAVIVENAGHGSDWAVPIAHEVIAAAYRIDEKKPVKRDGAPGPVRTL